ncbi:unnamed protein product [Prunus armeniaca]|uniref:Uncharacterized protein n=1 Tax=Prunus armeniaca TaxID=36596 RepID=A0A6J5VA55_PRUAR|nr:unnamed protein product [Prunus armeniaca]
MIGVPPFFCFTEPAVRQLGPCTFGKEAKAGIEGLGFASSSFVKAELARRFCVFGKVAGLFKSSEIESSWGLEHPARLSVQGGVESAIDSGEVGLSSLCHWGGLARSWSRSGTGCRSFGKVSAVSTISAELSFGSWADRVSPFPSERCLPFGKQRFEGALSTLVELGPRLGSRSIAELLGLAFGEFRNLRLLRQVPGVEAPVLRSWVPGKIVGAAWRWVFAGFELGGVGKGCVNKGPGTVADFEEGRGVGGAGAVRVDRKIEIPLFFFLFSARVLELGRFDKWVPGLGRLGALIKLLEVSLGLKFRAGPSGRNSWELCEALDFLAQPLIKLFDSFRLELVVLQQLGAWPGQSL